MTTFQKRQIYLNGNYLLKDKDANNGKMTKSIVKSKDVELDTIGNH